MKAENKTQIYERWPENGDIDEQVEAQERIDSWSHRANTFLDGQARKGTLIHDG